MTCATEFNRDYYKDVTEETGILLSLEFRG